MKWRNACIVTLRAAENMHIFSDTPEISEKNITEIASKLHK